jgi:hypothetical protein
MRSLFACPSCSCHVREGERTCPHCDRPLVSSDGTTIRTAAAAVMGLATVMTYSAGGCTTIETSSGCGTTSYTQDCMTISAYATSPSGYAWSSSGCVPNEPTKKCHDCVMGGCGPPYVNTTLGGNCTTGVSSFSLYEDYYYCLCGPDLDSGACGANCSRTCAGVGQEDHQACESCFGAAIAGVCKALYAACDADK